MTTKQLVIAEASPVIGEDFSFTLPESIRTALDEQGHRVTCSGTWLDFRGEVGKAKTAMLAGHEAGQTLTQMCHNVVIAAMEAAMLAKTDPRVVMTTVWERMKAEAVAACGVKNASKLPEGVRSIFASYPTQYKRMVEIGVIPGQSSALKTHNAAGKALTTPKALGSGSYSQTRELARAWQAKDAIEAGRALGIEFKQPDSPTPKKVVAAVSTPPTPTLGLPVEVPEFADFQKVAGDLADLLAKLETKESRAALIATLARIADETREAVAAKPSRAVIRSRKGRGR